MPNKTLTAKVRLNTSQAEQAVARLERKIKALNNATNKAASAGNATNQLNKQLAKQTQIRRETEKTTTAWSKVSSAISKANNKLGTHRSILGGVSGKLKALASTYLGIMGTKAVTNTTDLLVGAQNRLNYVNANQLGDSGYNSNGNYSKATLNATQDAMDKMYASAQKTRTSYQDTMSTVSRNMALAGKAFDNNIDNAIRFQEIMSEAYVVGGASAAEISSSMYQLTQALGSGVLQGDELRSVREGAPLAYQAIEKFAQKVLETDESLKELAADGLITSEMVVAAIMNEGKALDKAFGQTRQTFGQTFDQIKNSALYAFQPVMEMLTDALNKAVDNGMVQKFEQFFTKVAKAVMIAFKAIEKGVKWIAENWNWLKHLIVAGLIVILAYQSLVVAQAIVGAISVILSLTAVQWTIMIVVAAVLALLYVFYLWKTGAIDTCTAIIAALAIVGVALLIIGLIFNIVWMLWVAGVLLAIAAILYFFEYVCGIGWAILTFIGNLVQDILNVLMGLTALIIAITANVVLCIINHILAFWNWLKALGSNISTLWQNVCSGMSSWFWNAIADMLEGCDWLVNALNKIAEFFGKDTISIEAIRKKGEDAAGNKGQYVDMTDAWNNGMNTFKYVDVLATADEAATAFGTGLSDWSWNDAYNEGYEWGSGAKDKLNEWGSKFQNKNNGEDELKNKLSLLDRLGEQLGLDFGGMGNFPTTGVGSGYSPDMDKLLKGIGDDTGSIADSMDLTNEDLEYLRKIADMEWKKEYTTANIVVDMTNNNTVNGDGDLDGIVTKLADKLYEEMDYLANGVYA